MMNRFALLIINLLTYFFMIWANYYTNSGAYNGRNIGEVSQELQHYLSASPAAFSIWSVIFVGILIFIISAFLGEKKGTHEQSKVGLWLAISNIFNGSWGFAFIDGQYPLSLLIMAGLLFSIIMIVVKLRMELDDEPLRVIFTIWWPIVIYLGWVIAASILNTASLIIDLGVDPYSGTSELIAVAMLAVATLIYLVLVSKRNLRESAMVGVWAFSWIAVEQWEVSSLVWYSALVAIVILLVAVGAHAAKNIDTSPMMKIKQRL